MSGTHHLRTRSNGLPVQFRDSPFALCYQQPGFTLDGSSTGARVDPALLAGAIGDMHAHVNVQNDQVPAFANPAKAFSDYTAPVGFQFGPRDNIRGPNFFLLDLSLGKTFPIVPEKINLKFRADAFNALNHPNFENPSFTGNVSLVAPARRVRSHPQHGHPERR